LDGAHFEKLFIGSSVISKSDLHLVCYISVKVLKFVLV